jgi:predicted CoA-binding protein
MTAFEGGAMRVLVPENSEFVTKGSANPIAEILNNCKTIAVVGLSSNPMRPSHGVAEYLQSAGYRIIPVNPNETEVLGEKSYPRLEDVPERIDVVDIFRRAEFVPQVVESAICVGAKVVWMQLGIENGEAAEQARTAGLAVVEDACILIEHKKRVTRDW